MDEFELTKPNHRSFADKDYFYLKDELLTDAIQTIFFVLDPFSITCFTQTNSIEVPINDAYREIVFPSFTYFNLVDSSFTIHRLF